MHQKLRPQPEGPWEAPGLVAANVTLEGTVASKAVASPLAPPQLQSDENTATEGLQLAEDTLSGTGKV